MSLAVVPRDAGTVDFSAVSKPTFRVVVCEGDLLHVRHAGDTLWEAQAFAFGIQRSYAAGWLGHVRLYCGRRRVW